MKIKGTIEETLRNSIIDERAKSWDDLTDFGDWIREQDRGEHSTE